MNAVKVAPLSFDCIQCGLCALRCPAEIPQYHVGQLARRIYGKYIAPKAKHVEKRVKEIKKGQYDKEIATMKKMRKKKIEELYYARDIEED